jgi:hypothetical protein
MAYLTTPEALRLAADFARKAEYMRNDDTANFKTKAELYETASRVAILRAGSSTSGRGQQCPSRAS